MKRRRYRSRIDGYSSRRGSWEDGHYFPSRAELKRYRELLILERARQIEGLQVHPKFDCVVNKRTLCRVELDFRYHCRARGCTVFEDVKGYDNPLSKLKRGLVEALHGITVTLIEG